MISGLTRSKSPVYLFYPPDSCGRRPSALSELQYTNPKDRAMDEARISAQKQPSNISCYQNPAPRSDTPGRQAEYNAYNNRAFHDPSSARTYTDRAIIGAENHSFSRSSNSENPQEHTRTTRERVWYCDQPGCPYTGPYSEDLYEDCALGCHARRRDFSYETVNVRNRPRQR